MPSYAAGDVLLAEYDKVKTEQAQRIGVRDNLVYATLTAIGAVLLGTQQTAAGAHLLLALPPICAILGWTHLANDRMITQIGSYLREVLAPALAETTGQPALGWEDYHRRPGRWRRRKRRVQLAADVGTFCVPGVAAVLIWCAVRWSPVLSAVAVADLAAAGGLAYLIVAGRGGDGRA